MQRLRRISPLLLMLFAVSAGPVHTASTGPADNPGPLASEVRTALQTVGPGRSLTVIVKLKDQADLRTAPAGGRAGRPRRVIEQLQATARLSQGPLRSLLSARQSEGKVDSVTPFWIFNGLAVTATDDVIRELAARPEVASITPNRLIPSPARPAAASTAAAESNLELINAPALWDLGFTGQNVVVANMDSGVDASHPDLAAQWRGGTTGWFDPNGEHPKVPTDVLGHGTWAMGVIVGRDAGGTHIGVAPDARWIAVKIFNDEGVATTVGIHQGFQWLLDPDGNPATADGPDVVSNSWGLPDPGCNLEFQLDLRALEATGIVPIFAAGNQGPNPDTSISPANYPEALAVGATDNADGIAPFSSRGPSACGKGTSLYPEVTAPGVDIRTSDLAGLYFRASGTSLAVSHLAGALALLLSARPDLTAAEQRTAVTSTAQDLGAVGQDNVYGHGRVDALAAYQSVATLKTATVAALLTGKRTVRRFRPTTRFEAGDTVIVLVHVVDQDGRDLPGAEVTLAIEPPGGWLPADRKPAATRPEQTGANGIARFKYRTDRRSPRGQYTVEVTEVFKKLYTYRPGSMTTGSVSI